MSDAELVCTSFQRNFCLISASYLSENEQNCIHKCLLTSYILKNKRKKNGWIVIVGNQRRDFGGWLLHFSGWKHPNTA